MFFSIIIPFYNSEKTLSKTLEKLRGQKKNFELILVNDHSTDRSIQIANNYRKLFKNFKIINNTKNLGVSLSRNKGIKYSNGKYIIFLDSDDYLYPNSLENLEIHIKKFRYPEVIFTKFSKDTFPKNNLSILKKCFKKDKDYFFNHVLINKIPLDECWPYIVKKKFLIKNKINFSNYRVAEDQLYVLKLFSKLKSISFFKQNFYRHFNISNSLSDFMDFNSGFYCLKVLVEYLKIKNKISNKTLLRLCDFYIQNVLSMFSGILVQCNNKQVLKYHKFAKSKTKLFRSLVSNREKFKFKNFEKENFLLVYKDNIIKRKKKLLKNFIKTNYKFYIFCYSKFTGATIKILGSNSKKIIAIIDENKHLVGKKFKGYKIVNKNFFINKVRNNNYCIIVNHRDITINKIYNDLLNNGINSKKIIKFEF